MPSDSDPVARCPTGTDASDSPEEAPNEYRASMPAEAKDVARAPRIESPSELAPLRSSYTQSFTQILEQCQASLLVTTFQVGKLVVLRSDGGVLNTHFRQFWKPMGLAAQGDRLAIGTALEIWEYRNEPTVARRLEPVGRHDACFLPRNSVTTGDIQIHEMAWGRSEDGHSGISQEVEPELWFVNTRFSCLCTRDRNHSFVPRWYPPFVTALTPEDRCHLNGLCMVDGRPAFVTALGDTDTPGGWRANKKSGGVLIEVETGKVLLRGLSMPHSPRWHAGKLWLLESGTGSVGYIDPSSRQYRQVASLPGFTRGLDFIGNLAFVGLSQVRETAVFSGIPIADRPMAERCSGVWVIDTTTGQTVAYLKFDDALQEIFAVQVLPGVCFPDLINDDTAVLADSFVLPSKWLGNVPEPLRSTSRTSP